MRLVRLAAAAAIVATLTIAAKADDAACKTVRFADLGWTDLLATNALATVMLKGLGYDAQTKQLSLPATFAGLKSKQVDVFLGNWMPSQAADLKAYTEGGAIVTIAENLAGAGYGLVVPNYVTEAGVKSLADVGAHAAKFRNRIYGIEAGNDGNRIIRGLIADPANKLGDFELIESSEAAMLLVAKSAVDTHEWIVFLGWAPHPVMGAMQLTWLDGLGGSGFGPATVNTNIRAGYTIQCPNVSKFLTNLKFTLPMENEIMDAILRGAKPEAAAAAWLKANPDALNSWLGGVSTLDGQPGGLAAIRQSLGLEIAPPAPPPSKNPPSKNPSTKSPPPKKPPPQNPSPKKKK